NDGRLLEVDEELARQYRLWLCSTSFPPEDGIGDFLVVVCVNDKIILPACSSERALGQIVVVRGHDQQRRGDFREIFVDFARGEILIEESVQLVHQTLALNGLDVKCGDFGKIIQVLLLLRGEATIAGQRS